MASASEPTACNDPRRRTRNSPRPICLRIGGRARLGFMSARDAEDALHELEQRQAFPLDFNDEIRGDRRPVRDHGKGNRASRPASQGGSSDTAKSTRRTNTWRSSGIDRPADAERRRPLPPERFRAVGSSANSARLTRRGRRHLDRPADGASSPPAAYSAISTQAMLTVPLVKGGRFSAMLFPHHAELRRGRAATSRSSKTSPNALGQPSSDRGRGGTAQE